MTLKPPNVAMFKPGDAAYMRNLRDLARWSQPNWARLLGISERTVIRTEQTGATTYADQYLWECMSATRRSPARCSALT